MSIHPVLTCVFAAVALAAAGCDESLRNVAGPTPDLEPRLSSIQRLIFEAPDSSGRAACSGCHTSTGRPAAAGLNLVGASAHSNIVGVASGGKPGAVRVVPGDPDNSYLIQKIEGRGGIVGERMPRTGGPYLTEGQVLIIRRWIELGALND
jgi:Planctomycete cytochrome C